MTTNWANQVDPWVCHTCKRTVTCPTHMAVYGEGCHDEALHAAYQARTTQIVWTGVGIALVGTALVLINAVLTALK